MDFSRLFFVFAEKKHENTHAFLKQFSKKEKKISASTGTTPHVA